MSVTSFHGLPFSVLRLLLAGSILTFLIALFALIYMRREMLSAFSTFWQRHIEKCLWCTTVLAAIVMVNAIERWYFYYQQMVAMGFGPTPPPMGFDGIMQAQILLVIAFVLVSVSASAIFLIRSKSYPLWWLARYNREQMVLLEQKQ